MKINKLLFFLLAVFSLNSCVEYVDNGTKPDGPDKPEEQKFTAKHNNAEEAKYVGDDFEFTAMLNNLDVTSTTIFKVNGTQIKGNIYTPHKIGSHSVVATMDNLTANFKFTVLEKDEEEPEPTGNRIEYDDKSYAMTTTAWILSGDSAQKKFYSSPQTINGNEVVCSNWILVTTDDTDLTKANYYMTNVYVPVKSDGSLALPDEATPVLKSGRVVINATTHKITALNNYMFNSVTDTDADYTSTSTLENSKIAELFWDGAYGFSLQDLRQVAKNSNVVYKFNNSLSRGEIQKLKLKK